MKYFFTSIYILIIDLLIIFAWTSLVYLMVINFGPESWLLAIFNLIFVVFNSTFLVNKLISNE